MKMRQAIADGKSFYDWLRSQSEKPSKTELAILQNRFDEMKEALTIAKSKRREGQFIVISTKDNKPLPFDRKSFHIFSTDQEASEHGKQYYLYRHFKVMSYMVWSRTFEGRVLIRVQKNALRSSFIQPAPILSPSVTTKTNKGILDKISQLESDLLRLSIKGDTIGVARISQTITKLKKQKPK